MVVSVHRIVNDGSSLKSGVYFDGVKLTKFHTTNSECRQFDLYFTNTEEIKAGDHVIVDGLLGEAYSKDGFLFVDLEDDQGPFTLDIIPNLNDAKVIASTHPKRGQLRIPKYIVHSYIEDGEVLESKNPE